MRRRRSRRPPSSHSAFPDEYYDDLVAGYRARRDALLPSLRAAGFRVHEPAGAYYVMTDIRDLTDEDDVTFAMRLIREPGVAAVPGSSFFSRAGARTRPSSGSPFRSALETLAAAAERLARHRRAGLTATAGSLRPALRPRLGQVRDGQPRVAGVVAQQRIRIDGPLHDLAAEPAVDDREDRARAIRLEARDDRVGTSAASSTCASGWTPSSRRPPEPSAVRTRAR